MPLASYATRPLRLPPLAAPPPPRRVLVVTPHFAPIHAPDGQRAHLILPHLAAHGWQAEVLTVQPEFVEAALDPELASTLPAGIRIHRVAAMSPRATRRWNWGSLARRAYASLRARGNQLLAHGRFDLVFFTTCQFGVLTLGPYWQRRHGVPYVLDFHDEWAGDYYRRHPAVRPPGGRIKYAISHALARWQEGAVVRQAAEIVSVSQRYNTNLVARHPSLDPARLHVLPFGAAEADFQVLKQRHFDHGYFTPSTNTNWAYVGRGGPTMKLAARSFFLALQRAFKMQTAPADLHLHFIGTAYALGEKAVPTFTPLGSSLAPGVTMHEQTARVPHFTALQVLCDADAILLFGADDPGYSASKLVPCLLAQRPLLGIFHRGSEGSQLVARTGGTAVVFDSEEPAEAIAERIYEEWFVRQGFQRPTSVSESLLNAHGSTAMTERLAAIFSTACRSINQPA